MWFSIGMFQNRDPANDLLKTTFEIKSMEEVAQKLGVTMPKCTQNRNLVHLAELTRMVQESSNIKNHKT